MYFAKRYKNADLAVRFASVVKTISKNEKEVKHFLCLAALHQMRYKGLIEMYERSRFNIYDYEHQSFS